MVNIDVTDGTETTEQETTESYKPASLADMIGAELRELALQGASYKKKIAEAKTAPKKKLYKNKLKKNSEQAAQLILALERLQIGQKIKENRQQQELIDERTDDERQLASSRRKAPLLSD
jgi:hypothetical protein